jgi:hypothetical protein
VKRPTLASVAKEARALFSTDNPRGVWSITDHENEPEWVRDLCYAAHGGSGPASMLPDDYRYGWIVDALDCFEDCGAEDLDDATSQADDRIGELEADIYTHALTAWVGSHGFRPSYCDEAVAEYGMESADTITRLQLGQLAEMREVYHSVLHSLSERVTELQDEAEDEDEGADDAS